MENTSWKVTSTNPNSGTVITINEGIFQFPKNETAEPIEYVVTYYSDTCNCTCQKTVVVEPGGCECSITSKTESIQADAGNYNVGKINIVGACDIAWEKIENPDDFVSNISVDNGIIYADIAENVGDARQAKFKTDCGDDELIINQAESGACVIDWNSYSDSECKTCDCGADDFELLETSINVPGDGLTNYAIARVNTCVGHIAFVESKNWGCTIPDGSTLKLTVPTNSGGNRSETITFTYQDRCNKEIGEKTLELSQAAGCPASGDVITGDREVPGCASSWGGHLHFKTGDTAFTSDVSIVGDGTVVIGGFLDSDSQPGYKMIAITTSENPSTSVSRSGSLTITVGVNGGGTCTYTVPITQKKRDSSYCQTLSQATIKYTNNTGVQIQDGIGYLYDSNDNEIGEFRIDATTAGNYWEQPVGGKTLGKTVAKVIAKMHLADGSGNLVCRNCLGSGIIGETLEANHRYTVDIGNNVC